MDTQARFVGIDVSARQLAVARCGSAGQGVGPVTWYGNDPAGVAALVAAMQEWSASGPEPLVVGVESTGPYHQYVVETLTAALGAVGQVHVLNPRALKWFRQMTLTETKTDPVDARLLAQYVATRAPWLAPPRAAAAGALCEATRYRRRLVETRTRLTNTLQALVTVHWPGVLAAIGGLRGRFVGVLAVCPGPADVRRRGVARLAALRTPGGARVGRPFATQLVALARALGDRPVLPLHQVVLHDLAGQLMAHQHRLAALDAAIAASVTALDAPSLALLHSIPGIGPVSAAAILAEVDDIRRFPTPEAFIGYCGLSPTVWESGTLHRPSRMSRHGNRMLKLTFLVASGSARQCNPALRAFYQRLRQRGKSPRVAGGAVGRKLALVAYAVLTSRQPWSAAIAARGLAQSAAALAPREEEPRLMGVAAGAVSAEAAPGFAGRQAGKTASRSVAPRRHSTTARRRRPATVPIKKSRAPRDVVGAIST